MRIASERTSKSTIPRPGRKKGAGLMQADRALVTKEVDRVSAMPDIQRRPLHGIDGRPTFRRGSRLTMIERSPSSWSEGAQTLPLVAARRPRSRRAIRSVIGPFAALYRYHEDAPAPRGSSLSRLLLRPGLLPILPSRSVPSPTKVKT
jgi:hypothetical protein